MVLLIVLVTSLVALTLAWATGIASLAHMRRAAGVALETVGAATIFLTVNVALGVTLILGLRVLTPLYPTLYEVADVSLLILSVLQALMYQGWRHSRATAISRETS